MRVKVNTIGAKEIELREDIFASTWEMDSYDVKFIDNIHIICKFVKVEQQILVRGSVLVHKLITCSRCLEEVKQKSRLEFNFNYNLDSLGTYLEVDQDIREHILLNFPMKVLCRPDCKGLCSICGANLNYQQCNCSCKKVK